VVTPRRHRLSIGDEKDDALSVAVFLQLGKRYNFLCGNFVEDAIAQINLPARIA